MSYPKWLYHKEEIPKIVEDEAQEKALGKGWEDSPAKFEEKTKSKEENKSHHAMKVDELKKHLVEDLGYTMEDVDHLKKSELLDLVEGKK